MRVRISKALQVGCANAFAQIHLTANPFWFSDNARRVKARVDSALPWRAANG